MEEVMVTIRGNRIREELGRPDLRDPREETMRGRSLMKCRRGSSHRELGREIHLLIN